MQYPNFLFPGKTQYSDEENPFPQISNQQKLNSINPLNWIKIGYKLYCLKPDLIIYRFWLPFMAPSYIVTSWIAKLNNKTKILEENDYYFLERTKAELKKYRSLRNVFFIIVMG